MSATAEYPDQGPIPPEASEFLLAMDHLEEARTNFFQACSTYAEKPADKNGLDLNSTSSGYANAFAKCVESMYVDTEMATFVKEGTGLLKTEDARYVDALNSLLSDSTLNKLAIDENEVEEALTEATEIIDNPDDLKDLATEQLISLFASGLIKDTVQFISAVEGSKAARRTRLRQSIGKHVLDVGKITAGVAAGIVLSRLGGKGFRA